MDDLPGEAPSFATASRTRLTTHHLPRYPSESLFDRIARAVCRAECLPRKELYEAWEVARRTRRRFRGGGLYDLACGHGLTAWLMLLLDDTSPGAIAIDKRIPGSAAPLGEELARTWPRLAGRVTLVSGKLEEAKPSQGDLLVSVHACGRLTDRVLDSAIGANARVAAMPCCHDRKVSDTGGLDGWMAEDIAIDATRAARLRAAGYHVYTQTIPASITPKNRLLLASPIHEARHR